jgi:hypothetical protein
VLDLNAARHRFTERSAGEVVALLNAELPLLELLEPQRSRRAINPLFKGAYAFERVENTRLAWYARDFLLRERPPVPERMPTQLQKDLELVKLRLLECRQPRELDVWLHSAIRVAKALNPYLAPDDAGAVWARIVESPCYGTLQAFQRHWLALFLAVGQRQPARMAELASGILGSQGDLVADAREYLLLAALTGYTVSGQSPRAVELWEAHSEHVRDARPAFRLLRCRAEPTGCVEAFASYAGR